MDNLTLEEKIGQMMVVGFTGKIVPDYLLGWLRAGRVGGVILFQRNVETPQQVAELVASLHAAAKYPLLVSIDQEGGTVARFREGFTESPGLMALSAAGNLHTVHQMHAVLAEEMAALGINWVYAPVADVTHDIRNPSVGTRSAGSDPMHVAQVASEAAAGYQSRGVAATAKHFPGLGNTPTDTHVALAVIDGPLDYLWENDLVPFRSLIDAGVETVMLTHVKFPALNAQYPATMAREIAHDLLRGEMGFEGAVTTDCMEMKAIADHYGAGESAVLAALAGVDLILFSHTPSMQEQAYAALLDAARSGRLPMARVDEALARIERLKSRYPARTQPDVSAIATDEHLATAQMAARAGVTVISGGENMPIRNDQTVCLVEFSLASVSEVMENLLHTSLSDLMGERFNVVQRVVVNPDRRITPRSLIASLGQAADVLVVVTRNAHLAPKQLEDAKALLGVAHSSVLVVLRNPYDAGLLDADTVICTHGDSNPSILAAVDALAGDYVPAGQPTVPLT